MCTTPHFLAYFLSALSRTHFTHFHTCTCGRWWKVPAAADPQQNAVRRRLIIRVPCRLIGTCIAELAAVGHLAFRYVDLSELESSPPTGQVLDETAPRVDKTAAPRPSLFPNGACTATGSSKGPGTETAADFPECFTAAHSSGPGERSPLGSSSYWYPGHSARDLQPDLLLFMLTVLQTFPVHTTLLLPNAHACPRTPRP